VVEAYWIGNELVAQVEVRWLYDALTERFGKQLTGRPREWVLLTGAKRSNIRSAQ
jgi:hypothetical protein